MDDTQEGPASCLRLDDQLCFALYAATGAVVRAYRPLLRGLGLTYPQYIVLMALWEADGVGIGELGARLGLAPSALTPVLDRLVRSGLVERRRGRTDRRVVVVVLTAAGTDLEQDAARVQHEVRCQTGLTPEALAGLRGDLRELTAALGQDVDEDAEVVLV